MFATQRERERKAEREIENVIRHRNGTNHLSQLSFSIEAALHRVPMHPAPSDITRASVVSELSLLCTMAHLGLLQISPQVYCIAWGNQPKQVLLQGSTFILKATYSYNVLS